MHRFVVEPSFDPYAVLGVERDADHAAIAAAFRRRVRCSHPDTQHPNEDQFALAIAAYGLLRDPPHRAEHDHRSRSQDPTTGTAIPVRIHRPRHPDLWVGPVRNHLVR